ncbi:cytochrome-b5 reductase [Schizopora paradoxa]|uniref:NADH-cytochrome b5 reductase n=1 Tax=Schizopora paradoxa TaxID=27342 RepID=A0A0H2SGF5_9AGAM|nr:cytochrome-b5 reductase [Schizopora paradoxa]
MSFALLRTVAGRRCTPSLTRRFATEASAPKKSSSNAALYLTLTGIAGLGAYTYYFRGGAPAATVQKKPPQEKSPLDPEKFIDFKLKKVEPYNHNTSKFIFELPDGQASLLPVASCVVVKSSDPEALKTDKGKPVIRPYTPISDAPGELTFLIKKYEKGVASVYIHNLKPGESLSIKGPIPKFPYKINEFDNVALIGGGSGITPLHQILTYALADKSNKTKFTLIYSNVTEKDILLREEFDELKKKYPDTFNVIYFLDKAEKDWKGEKGYISKEIIKNSVAGPEAGDKVKVFVCGPPGQVAALSGKKDGMKQGELGGILKELGYKDDQVFKF